MFTRLFDSNACPDGVLVVNTSSSAWRKIGPYVKSYVSNLLHLGPMLVDERLTRLAIAHFGRVHHLLVPFSRLPNKLAKVNTLMDDLSL